MEVTPRWYFMADFQVEASKRYLHGSSQNRCFMPYPWMLVRELGHTSIKGNSSNHLVRRIEL